MFEPLPAKDIDTLWPYIHPIVATTVRSMPTFRPKDIAQSAKSYAKLWLDGRPPRAFALTSFVSYGRGTWLRVWLGSQDNKPLDISVFDEFRRHTGCDGLEFVVPVDRIDIIEEPMRIEGLVQRLTYTSVEPGEVPESIYPIGQENIHRIWPKIEPLIERVLTKMDTHTFDPEHIKSRLIEGNASLFVQWRDQSGPEGITITEAATYPRGRWVRVWLTAAAWGAKMDVPGMTYHVKRLVATTGSRGIEYIGRHGWMRRLAPLFPGVPIAVEAAVMRPYLYGQGLEHQH